MTKRKAGKKKLGGMEKIHRRYLTVSTSTWKKVLTPLKSSVYLNLLGPLVGGGENTGYRKRN